MTEIEAAASETVAFEPQVVELVRELAFELGGERAARATHAAASLERDLGLGSLERVELMLRLESAFGRQLDESCLTLDTPAALAQALSQSPQRAFDRPTGAGNTPAPPALSFGPIGASVSEALWIRGRNEPQRIHAYLRGDDGQERNVTYGQLLEAARGIAGGLRERGVERGETVGLMLPTGFDFLRSFQGTLLAGGIAVPIYPPVRLDHIEEYAERQSAILAHAGVRVLITFGRAQPVAALLRKRVRCLEHVVTPDTLAKAQALTASIEAKGEDPALIQYTSGSTGNPKGVLLTHANLLANIVAIARGVDVQPIDVGVSWLPLYHDMGLIGTWLFCLVQGLPLALQSPLSFLARPERWLWTIHERRATLSAAPNFAYELCVRKIPDAALQGLDLSSWRCALNGAEPVSAETLERFARRFAPCGLRREALMPVYGLAENSVALCFPPPGRGPLVLSAAREPFEREGRIVRSPGTSSDVRFVSVGTVLPEHAVRLVDEEGQDVAEDAVGRLLFRGPSMTPGYYRQPEETASITQPGGWLDSGDLAFAHEGEIYIAGRKKDLIIKGGRNLVPQEIEEAVTELPEIRKGCVVAFGVERVTLGTESLVIAAETRIADPAAHDAIVAAILARVQAQVGVPPDEVLLLPAGTIPKTSSGKVRRAETRSLFLRGVLGGRAVGPSVQTRARLAIAWSLRAIRSPLRGLGRIAYTASLASVVLSLGAIFRLLILCVRDRHRVHVLGHWAAWTLLRAAGCRTQVEGLERLPGDGAFILASNHTSYADVVVLLALLPRDFLFVAKHEIRSWPVIGTFVERAGHLTVDRWDASQSVADARRIADALANGERVLFFPEGTFTAASGLRPFRLGAFITAAQTGVPVVPLALRGVRRALPEGARVPRPGRIHLWVGAPLRADGVDWAAAVRLRDGVASEIGAHCGEPRLDLVAGGPVRPPEA